MLGCTTDPLSSSFPIRPAVRQEGLRSKMYGITSHFPAGSRASEGNSGASMSFWADSMQLRAPWAGLLGLLAPSRRPKKSRTHLNLPFPSIVKKRGTGMPCAACVQAHFLNEAGGTSESRCGCGALLKRRRRRVPRRLERVDAAAIDPCVHTERHVATRCNIVRQVAT